MPALFRSKRIPLALGAFWTVVTAWMLWNMQARGVDPSTFESDSTVTVSAAPGLTAFTPAVDTAGVGLVFYPGALADPEAYAPMARAVAEAGYAVVVVELPYRLAPFEGHRDELAARTRALVWETAGRRSWVVGGHSKGGKLAAQFVRDHGADAAGLLLIGTSHPREDDLTGLDLDVTKVYGSEDGLASEEEVDRFGANLPPSTHWVRVEGGNHAQFGWYGWQLGDGRATITRAEQQAATVRAVVAQLQRVGGTVEAEGAALDPAAAL